MMADGIEWACYLLDRCDVLGRESVNRMTMVTKKAPGECTIKRSVRDYIQSLEMYVDSKNILTKS